VCRWTVGGAAAAVRRGVGSGRCRWPFAARTTSTAHEHARRTAPASPATVNLHTHPDSARPRLRRGAPRPQGVVSRTGTWVRHHRCTRFAASQFGGRAAEARRTEPLMANSGAGAPPEGLRTAALTAKPLAPLGGQLNGHHPPEPDCPRSMGNPRQRASDGARRRASRGVMRLARREQREAPATGIWNSSRSHGGGSCGAVATATHHEHTREHGCTSTAMCVDARGPRLRAAPRRGSSIFRAHGDRENPVGSSSRWSTSTSPLTNSEATSRSKGATLLRWLVLTWT